MKAKYKIGVLLSYQDEVGNQFYNEIKAVISHHDHAEYLMKNDDHVAEADVMAAYAPIASKKSVAKKRGPKKAKAEDKASAQVDEAAM